MKIYIQDHNRILSDVAEKLDLTNDFKEADKVLLWQDVIELGKGIAELALQTRKPLIVVQHGANSHIDYGPPNNYKLLADKICVWGTRNRDYLLEQGIPASKIVMTGSTIFNYLKPKVKHSGINIVFRPAHWDKHTLPENALVRDALREMPYNIITKITESMDDDNFDNVVQSHRDEPGHIEACIDVLSKADAVVAIAGDGTFEMLAYAMDVPVITANVWDQKPFLDKPTPAQIYSEACDLVDMEYLEAVIEENLKNPDKNKASRRKVLVEWTGIDLDNPLERILKVIHDA